MPRNIQFLFIVEVVVRASFKPFSAELNMIQKVSSVHVPPWQLFPHCSHIFFFFGNFPAWDLLIYLHCVFLELVMYFL